MHSLWNASFSWWSDLQYTKKSIDQEGWSLRKKLKGTTKMYEEELEEAGDEDEEQVLDELDIRTGNL